MDGRNWLEKIRDGLGLKGLFSSAAVPATAARHEKPKACSEKNQQILDRFKDENFQSAFRRVEHNGFLSDASDAKYESTYHEAERNWGDGGYKYSLIRIGWAARQNIRLLARQLQALGIVLSQTDVHSESAIRPKYDELLQSLQQLEGKNLDASVGNAIYKLRDFWRMYEKRKSDCAHLASIWPRLGNLYQGSHAWNEVQKILNYIQEGDLDDMSVS